MMELDENDELRHKMKRLKPELQGVFMRYLRQMCDQETDMMIEFIEESRSDIKKSNEEILGEQKNLRENQLTASRSATSLSLLRPESVADRPRSTSTSPRPPLDEVVNKLAVERYMRKRERTSKELEQQQQQEQEPEYQDGSPEPELDFHEKAERRSQSAHASSGVPPLRLSGLEGQTQSDDEYYDKETEEIMGNMRTVSARIENERERQAERVRKLREKKRAKRDHQVHAIDLLEKAGETEKIKSKDKQRQELKVKELLEKKKKERAETPGRLSPRPFLTTPTIDEDLPAEPLPEKPSRRRKKKDKHGEKDSNPIQEEDNKENDVKTEDAPEEVQYTEEKSGEEKSLRRKKKKSKNKDPETTLDDDNEKEEKEEKKKKKKKKSKEKEKDGEKDEDTKEKKKKKKKKKDKKQDEEEEYVNVAWD